MKRDTLMNTLLTTALIAGTAQASTVYFGTSNSEGIYVAQLDPQNGTLSEPQLAVELKNPGFIAFHPNKPFLYSTGPGLGDGKNGGVAAMKITPDGSLTLLNRQSTKDPGTCHVSVDASGQCLMAANYSGGSVVSFKILEDGSISEAQSFFKHEGSGQHEKRQKKPYAHSVFMNPANTHAYASDLGIDKVMIYKLDAANGVLLPAGFAEVPGGSMGPRHMKWSADGKTAYVLNELDLSVSIFKPGKKPGSLEFIKTVSTLPDDADKSEMTCAEIRIHPNGKFVYASNRDLTEQGRDSISVFTCLEDGFQPLETVPAQVWIPRNFNIDPAGKWLLVGGQKSNNVAIFSVDPKTGRLTFTGTKVPFDCGPICIEFLP